MFFLISTIALFFLAGLSWIPGVCQNKIGIFDIIPNIWESVKFILSPDGNGLSIIAFAFLLYALLQSKSIQALFVSKRKWLQKRKFVTIAIITVTASFLASNLWWADEFIHFYPLVIPLLLSMGFDVFSSILCLYGGGMVGIIGSMSTRHYGHYFGIVNGGGISLTGTDGIIFRIIVWLILTSLIVFFNIWYCNKVSHTPEEKKIVNKEKNAEKIPPFNWKKKLILFLTFFFILISILGSLGTFPKLSSKVAEQIPDVLSNDKLNKEKEYKDLGEVDIVEKESKKMEIAEIETKNKGYWGIFGKWGEMQTVYLFTIGAIIICLLDKQKIINTLTKTVTQVTPIILSYIFSYAIAKQLSKMELNTGLVNRLPKEATPNIGFVIFPVLFITFFILCSLSLWGRHFVKILGEPLRAFGKNILIYSVTTIIMARFLAEFISPFNNVLQISLQKNKITYKQFLKKVWLIWLIIFIVSFGLVLSLPLFIKPN